MRMSSIRHPIRFVQPMNGPQIDRLVREYAGNDYVNADGYPHMAYVTPGIMRKPLCGVKLIPIDRVYEYFHTGSLNGTPLETYSGLVVVAHNWYGSACTFDSGTIQAIVDWHATGLHILLATGNFYDPKPA